ncbi:hypothetical protein CVT24_011117 [Panaeolus cyanescens]|uniref:Uncharacterized protein n=1 Tax=Panaeolus cyanescens TaxID=181874 RepID=A0A409YG55_9AGAR|nr:hypothetical protein CVT24_011117 [Panaeolus cyanescens]
MVPSSLLEPLQHNKPPTSSEISQIEQFRTSIDEAAKANQEKRRLLLQELEILDKIEEKLQKQVQVCDVIMSPIRHLPDDIIYEIVTTKALLPGDGQSNTDPRHHTPSIIAQVVVSRAHRLFVLELYQSSDAPLERIKRFHRLSHPLKLSVYLHETSYAFNPSEDALRTLPILFGQNSPHEIPEAGVPFILKWLIHGWSETHPPINLHLDIPPLIRHLHALTDMIAGQQDWLTHGPGNDTLFLHRGSVDQQKRQLDDSEDVYGFYSLLLAFPDLRRFWMERVDAPNCRLFPSDIPQDLPVCGKLQFLYISYDLRYGEWLHLPQIWPQVEAAWVCLELLPRASINTIPDVVIRHNHMKVLNIRFNPRNRDIVHSIVPLVHVHFPLLEDLYLHFTDVPGTDPEFVNADFRRAFPRLARVMVYFTWTMSRPLQDFDLLLRSFALIPGVSTTLVVTVLPNSISNFTDILDQTPNLFVQPNQLALNFHFEVKHFSILVPRTKERLIQVISKLRSERSHLAKTTLFHVNYFGIISNFTSMSDLEHRMWRSVLDDMLGYIRKLRSTLGEDTVQISIMVPSSLLEPLRHNKPPTPSEISQIEQFRTYIDEAAKANQEKRRLLLQELEILDKIEEKLQKQVQVCDVIMSPIRHLPDDIIYQIVTSESLLPEEYEYTDPRTHNPSILAKVCRSWRTVLHLIPRLWDRIRIDCSLWNYQPIEALLGQIRLFYRLSHPFKLSVQLDEKFYDFDPSEDALRTLPILFGLISPHEMPELGVPRVLKWLFGSWSETRRLPINLHLEIPFLIRLLHAVTDTTTKQHQPRGLDALYLDMWAGDTYSWEELTSSNNCWHIHRLLTALPDLRCLWISSLNEFMTDLFPSEIPEDLPVCDNLRFLYIGYHVHFTQWPQIPRFWTCVEGAWVCIESAPSRVSIEMITDSVVRHNRMKVLNIDIKSQDVYASGGYPLVFPLSNVQFPSLEELGLYFTDVTDGRIEFIETDFRQAFPSLAKVTAHVTWTPRWPLQDLVLLLRAFMLPNVLISLVITIRSQDVLYFINILKKDLNTFVLPNDLVLTFQWRPSSDFSAWKCNTIDGLTDAISLVQSARNQKRTLIHFIYFDSPSEFPNLSVNPDRFDDSGLEASNLHSPRLTGIFIGSPESHSDHLQSRESDRYGILRYLLNVQFTLGEDMVDVSRRPWGEQMLDPYFMNLHQFKQRYFS